ncbi:isopenicillin N synthase family oxygenase [Siculibacillus lacustris]|uniref:Isopenicillin N synthase family oxygenase n=1 Tax=Siculibacillus lacustris TaxID=1549641 RepID=A0A4Q9VZM0_9HYPH|nr:2-oxoglutarate and iron-dependent oxygenase domain-containing protein [Siculibacillus lacustris]TBW41298.1 isopenicillin N synthase family oxygenase [Siculibacillus lacustris]
MTETLPILDLRRLSGPTDDRAAFLAELGAAARDVGFFYLVGHGVPEALSTDIRVLARRFFALPAADKRAIDIVRSPHFRGYTPVGNEHTRGRPDRREQIDFAVERPAVAQDGTQPAWTRLQGPNQWPAALPELRPVVEAWQSALEAVGGRLFSAFAEALGLPADALAPIWAEAPNHRLKIIRYPGLIGDDGDQGVGPHKDGGFLTLLLQDVQAGLEVEALDGRWIAAPPIPGSFVVNIGELLELATDGYLRATVHRVVSPPAEVDRLSVAFFFAARLGVEIPRLTLPPDLARLARGPASDPANPLFRDTGLNQLKQRLRSHPDVARAHHADLAALFEPPPSA